MCITASFHCRAGRGGGDVDCGPGDGGEAGDRTAASPGTKSPRAGAGRSSKEVRNAHPTVTPVALMRWLVRLVTPPGGYILDAFVGSGTTLIAARLEGCGGIGIDQDQNYLDIAGRRIAAWREYE